jgi:hypothetical protein
MKISNGNYRKIERLVENEEEYRKRLDIIGNKRVKDLLLEERQILYFVFNLLE